MPILTQVQFTTRLTNTRPGIYLGAPAWNRRVSSMLPLVNAVGAYNGLANSANYMAMHHAIDALPAAKKLRYANPIRDLQQSMDNVYVTANPFTVHFAPAAGIGVPRVNATPEHQTNALLALEQLHGCAAGMALMQAICVRIANSGKRASVQAWNLQATNNCAVVGMSPVKTDLADALEYNNAGAGVAILAALNALGHGPMAGYAWLEAQVNACPIYNLVGLPSVIQSQNVHGANWISAAMIQAWCTAGAIFPAPLVNVQQVEDAKVVLGTVLRAGATAQAGEHTVVRWSPASTQFTDTLNVVRQRPPYIALAHELIHAYHNLCGDQDGHEIGTYSRVLYEFQCVGLGPWAGGAHTENGVRASAGVAVRTCY